MGLMDLGRKVVNGARTVARKAVDLAKRAYNAIRDRVKRLVGTFRSLFEEEVEKPGELEISRRSAAREAVKKALGENPLDTIVSASVKERQEMVPQLVDGVSRALGIECPQVKIRDLGGTLAGYYDAGRRELVVRQDQVDRSPMSDDEALELLDTILHEMYHAFQTQAMLDPIKHGISSQQAALWRKNFANYISAEQNQRLYWIQPVEQTARLFAHDVVSKF